ncbi:MAG TPA: hypothetical protein VIM11_18580, partial [Tepidisphaeraceae bacterium]
AVWRPYERYAGRDAGLCAPNAVQRSLAHVHDIGFADQLHQARSHPSWTEKERTKTHGQAVVGIWKAPNCDARPQLFF